MIGERPGMTLDYIYDICEQKIEGKKIFAKIIYDWDKVKTNYELMNIQESTLDDRELDIILDVLKEPAPRLQTGTFLHYLDNDKIEGITKNTEAWLETFRGLTGFSKRVINDPTEINAVRKRISDKSIRSSSYRQRFPFERKRCTKTRLL